MNQRDVWTQFIEHKKSTATIARELHLRECDVDRLISQVREALYAKRPMPWSGVA